MFKRIFTLSRLEFNTLPVLARNSKIMEEVGEFSEALLHKLGFLPHKTMKEPLVGEAADVILCVLDTLASAYPELSEDELGSLILEQIEKKTQKWKDVMKLRYDQRNSV